MTKKLFYVLLSLLGMIYTYPINAAVTAPNTPVEPVVSTAENPVWYVMMFSHLIEENRKNRFMYWDGTNLKTTQYLDGIPQGDITDNYRWRLESANDGNASHVYLVNARDNKRIMVPATISNQGTDNYLYMDNTGVVWEYKLSSATGQADCATNQYCFDYIGYTTNSDPAYLNGCGTATDSSNNYRITIYKAGVHQASGWFFYPAPKSERTVTVASNNEDMGTVSIQGHESTTIITSESVTVEATAKSGYEFVNWTKDGGTEVSSDNPYTYSGKESIILTANFREKTYPEMKRKYQAANQQNRYLKKVSYFIGNEEKTVFEATTQNELPYTAMPTPVTTATTVGALIDKTTTKIVLPQGTTEFKMKFNAWTPQINGNNQELVWTSQAYYIDFDHSLSFEGNTDGVNEISDIAGSSGGNNNFGDSTGSADNGWTRTITLPSNLAPDTYRMRVVYYDGSNWNTTLFTTLNGTIQSGIAYDFDIVIEAPAPAERMVTVESADETMGTVAITSPSGTTGNSVNTADDVTVQATANSGYTFVNWTNKDGEAVVSTENPYTYTEAEDITLVANFQAVITGWTITWETSEYGTIKVLKGTEELQNGAIIEEVQTEVFIIPTPKPGYRFTKVYANDVQIKTTGQAGNGEFGYKTTINSNTTIRVDFVQNNYTLNWTTPQNGTMTVYKVTDTGETELVSGTSLTIGDKIKVVPSPEDKYEVSRVYYQFLSGGNITDITQNDDGYTFVFGPDSNPNLNYVQLTVEFTAKPLHNLYAQTTKKSNISKDSYVERLEVNDKILGNWSSFTDDNRSNQITLAAWVNFESSSYYADGMAIMGHYQGHYVGNGTTPSFTVSASSNGKMGIFSRTRNSSGGYPGTSSSTINEIDIPQGWFHLALTAKLEGSNIVYKLYVNGEETSASKTVAGNENSNLPYLPDNTDGLGCVLCFGGDMNCKFDDIMIWTEAISPEEVKEAMKGYTDAELASMTTLVGYYTCDDMLENQGTSKNIGSNKTYDLKLQNLKIKAVNPPTTGQKEPISEANLATYIQNSERDVPRGGEKLFEGDEDATWLTNGDENFGYIVKSDNTKRLAYDGFRKVALANDVLAVYHNGEPGLPAYVKEEDLESMTAAKAEMTSSYVIAGLDYTVQMPAVAKQWMPISMPAEVDLIAVENGNGVRPGKNFWYAEPVVNGENVNWNDITDEGNTDGTSYLNNLNPGIISVPELRVDQHFTFFTALGTPVVMRAYNQAYAAAQMPQAGVLKFVANPYATTVRAAQLTGEAANMTIYRMNTASGNFDPVEGTVTLKEFEPVFVFNNGGNPSMAPRYIGTKDVSGVIEAEAVYNVNVRGTEGAVEVEAFVPADVEIFTVNGVKVAAEKVEGTRMFNLQSGIYVVRTVADGNAETVKVVVE